MSGEGITKKGTRFLDRTSRRRYRRLRINYELATKQKYGAIQPDGTVPKINLQKLTAQNHYF